MGFGRNVIRVDGDEKVTGRTRFCPDMQIPDLWHGVIVRSEVGCGRLLGLEIDPALEFEQVVVVTPADIPGKNEIPIIDTDMPCLCSERVSYLGEPVALVAAPTRELAIEAAHRVRARVEPRDGLYGIRSIVERIALGESDVEVIARYRLASGDVEDARSKSHVVTAGEYTTGAQEHAYLETQSMICIPEGDGVRCLGSMQCPYYVRPAVAHVLGVDPEQVVVEQAPTGGAFGGKEDFPSSLASHAALLAIEAGRPVRMVFDRQEDMAYTTKRHASWSNLTTGVDPDGNLLFIDGEIVLDAGAYTTLSPVVLSRALLHACGVYRCLNVRLKARAVKSNMPPSGAFRGFGAPQSLFAIEAHMDDVATSLGVSPAAIRRANILHPGDRMATGQVLEESVGIEACLDSVMQRSRFDDVHEQVDDARDEDGARTVSGIGLAACLHGAGFTGNGERNLGSRAGLRLQPDGSVSVLAANTEMGQGLLTAYGQIVSDALGIEMDRVRCDLPDTSRVPDSGPTVASRSTMIVGKILDRCAEALVMEMAEMLGAGTRRQGEGFESADGGFISWEQAAARIGQLDVLRTHEVEAGQQFDEDAYTGTAYPVFSWGAAVVQVVVDVQTYVVTPQRLWLAYEIGRAVNPMAARGQLEGGSLQALGWGLCENVTIEGGRYLQDRFQTYIVPTSVDTPRMDLEIIEIPWKGGPGGAKGLGELPMNAVAPALRNAVAHALATAPGSIPLTPESLLQLSNPEQR